MATFRLGNWYHAKWDHRAGEEEDEERVRQVSGAAGQPNPSPAKHNPPDPDACHTVTEGQRTSATGVFKNAAYPSQAVSVISGWLWFRSQVRVCSCAPGEILVAYCFASVFFCNKNVCVCWDALCDKNWNVFCSKNQRVVLINCCHWWIDVTVENVNVSSLFYLICFELWWLWSFESR